MGGIRARLGGVTDAVLEAALAAAGWTPGSPADGVVFDARRPPGPGWKETAPFLREAFLLTRDALRGAAPVVYVVALDDCYGRGSRSGAVIACGLLSAARTAALEARDVPVNVLAVGAAEDTARIARWVVRLLEGDGLHGELVRLGGGHLGDVQP